MGKHNVSLKQISVMLSYMEKNKHLVVRRAGCKEERVEVDAFWRNLTEILNSKELNGAKKAPRDWAKFFNDYKCRVKKRAHQIARNELSYTTGESMTLSPLQKRVCALMWPDQIKCESPQDHIEIIPMESLQEPSDDEDHNIELDMHNIMMPTPGQSSATEQPRRDEFDKSWDELAEIERVRLEISRAKYKALLARNAIEKQKADAMKELAGAAWALVNVLKNTNDVANNIERRRTPSKDGSENEA